MKNKIIFIVLLILIIIIGFVSFYFIYKSKNTEETSIIQNINENIDNSSDNNDILNNEPISKWAETELFYKSYSDAEKKLNSLSQDEKIGQLFLVRYPETDALAIEILKKYKFGGYLLFARDFKGKTESQVKNMIKSLQDNSNIPLLIAVDEEGGTVVRVSSNPNLATSKFKSPQELYNLGGLELIKQDTINKSLLLYNLGINLNLAPVVDVSTNPQDYMYQRAFGKNATLTANYAKEVISASKQQKVSYTLKHFPGYGNNVDTHTGTSIDTRTYDDILNNDILPFKSGIEAGAEAVLVSHNIVTSIDDKNPASLSKEIHNLLRDTLNFTGVIITDDLAMGAVSSDSEAVIKAINAGNDLIITTDYEGGINQVKEALNDGRLSQEAIDNMVFKILAWKYYKGML